MIFIIIFFNTIIGQEFLNICGQISNIISDTVALLNNPILNCFLDTFFDLILNHWNFF